jgi:hypothetical protein
VLSRQRLELWKLAKFPDGSAAVRKQYDVNASLGRETPMRNIAICLIVILCSWVTALGQSGVPQWKVVQTLKLANQTAEISGATLFTPTTSVGMYRVALYISCGPTAVGDGTFDAYVNWEVGGYKKAGGLLTCPPRISPAEM